MTDAVGVLRRRLFYHASDPWEGMTLALEVALIEATENWETLQGGGALCPDTSNAADVREAMKLDAVRRRADEALDAYRNTIVFLLGGWMPIECYERP